MSGLNMMQFASETDAKCIRNALEVGDGTAVMAGLVGRGYGRW